MGFNSEYVTLKVSSHSKYYEDLGYKIPKRKSTKEYYWKYNKDFCYDYGNTFQVNIKDLPNKSGAYIDYSCDCCGKKIQNLRYSDYTRRNHNGKYYCHKCANAVLTSGENHPHWNPNLTEEERRNERATKEDSYFIKSVLKRDNYRCICCGQKGDGNNLVAHHLNGYKWDIEHRYDPANGVTLCKKCHQNFHSLYGIGKNTKEQFEEWYGNRLDNLDKYEEVTSLPKIYCIEDNILYEDKYECAKQLGIPWRTIWSVCTGICSTYHSKHYIYYDNYLKMSSNEISELLQKGNHSYGKDFRIICPEMGWMFNSYIIASEFINYNHYPNIYNCAEGRQLHAGKYNDIGLSWIWAKDFESLSSTDQLDIINSNINTIEQNSYLFNLYKEFTKQAS